MIIFIVQKDVAPPVILSYNLETIMDSCGSSSSSVTLREKIELMLAKLKVNGSDKNGVGKLIYKSGLGHYFKLVEENWVHGYDNLLHFFFAKAN